MSVKSLLGMAQSMQQEIEEALSTKPEEEIPTKRNLGGRPKRKADTHDPMRKIYNTVGLTQAQWSYVLSFEGNSLSERFEELIIAHQKYQPLGPYAGRERDPKTGRWIAGKKYSQNT